MPPLAEIHLPNRAVPRYRPDQAFPPYRYVPGRSPHPIRDPHGHSYEAPARVQGVAEWDPAAWRALPDWLRGVDLFNAFFFWEAHEAWERLWAAKPKGSLPAVLLHGLIQVAAALLKVHSGSLAAATTLSSAGLEKIDRVARTAPALLGLNLTETIANFRSYFRPLSERTLPPLDASVPMLLLSSEAEA